MEALMASVDVAVPVLIRPHGGVVSAYVNYGHWVADCGSPYCHNALRLEYAQTGFVCLGAEDACGAAFDVAWPDPGQARQIVALLGYRPDRMTRNWLPTESVNDLLIENLAHGVAHSSAPELGAAQSHIVLDATTDRPTLRVFDEPLVIDAQPTLVIGA